MIVQGYAVIAKLVSENGTISNEVFFDWKIGEVRQMAKQSNLFVSKCIKVRYSENITLSNLTDSAKILLTTKLKKRGN